jgi:hypothetical protein
VRLPKHAGPEAEQSYLALVDRVLIDHDISAHEADGLVRLADTLELGRNACERLHLAYFQVEAMAIQQHACEASLRLFLAHRDAPDCPWLEVARLRNFVVFHQATDALSQESGTPKLLQDVQTVFRRSTALASEYPGLDWDADGDALVRLAGEAVQEYRDHQTAYNATKHGLAVIPSAPDLSLGAEGGLRSVGPVPVSAGSK